MMNFMLIILDINFAHLEFVCSRKARLTGGQISDYRITRIGDVIESNSYHIRLIRPSHDLGTSLGLRGVSRKVLQVHKSPWIKGASIRGPRMIIPTHIRRGKTWFLEGHQELRDFLLPDSRFGVENHLHTISISKEEGGTRAAVGRRLLSGLHHSINLLLTMAMCE